MPEEIINPVPPTENSETPVAEKPKRGRPRKPASPAVAPAPPEPKQDSPAVLALQSDIVALVHKRDDYQAAVGIKQAQFATAKAELDFAVGNVSRVEGDIQYRLSLISQMQGKPVQPPPVSYPGNGYTAPMATTIPYNVSSEPTEQTVGSVPEVVGGVNRGHATRAML